MKHGGKVTKAGHETENMGEDLKSPLRKGAETQENLKVTQVGHGREYVEENLRSPLLAELRHSENP